VLLGRPTSQPPLPLCRATVACSVVVPHVAPLATAHHGPWACAPPSLLPPLERLIPSLFKPAMSSSPRFFPSACNLPPSRFPPLQCLKLLPTSPQRPPVHPGRWPAISVSESMPPPSPSSPPFRWEPYSGGFCFDSIPSSRLSLLHAAVGPHHRCSPERHHQLRTPPPPSMSATSALSSCLGESPDRSPCRAGSPSLLIIAVKTERAGDRRRVQGCCTTAVSRGAVTSPRVCPARAAWFRPVGPI
jgi:hypothetical protein